MERIYNDTPKNIHAILPYVITDPVQAGKEIITSQKCYFYDTCAFRKHMELAHSEYIFNYIINTAGVVIITRTIIMELCSKNNELWPQHITYIENMHKAGIKILVMFEEDICNTLNLCYVNVAETNKYLSFAVRNGKSKVGTIETTLDLNPLLKKEDLSNNPTSDSSLASRFFREVRARKETQDNLGEELIGICVHLLSRLPDEIDYKYVVITEDKGAIAQLGRIMENIKEYQHKPCVAAITTPKLVQLMINDSVISTKPQVLEILVCGNAAENIKIFCSEKYDLSPVLKTMTHDELADKLINKDSIQVYY